MLTILHASDLQHGRPFRSDAAEAFLRLAQELRPDVTVVSGDLTQRAKVAEFRAAKALLDRLPGPVLVTPGNHDVPVYRFWERALAPYRNWHEIIAAELNSVVRVRGATFVTLNSSAPHRAIVNGRVNADQVEFARKAFAAASSEEPRVLVIHHHFVPAEDPTAGDPLPRARELVEAFESMGVDLVLGGHVHHTHIMTSRSLLPDHPGPGVPLIACGTTTSGRGRGREVGINSLNVVRVTTGTVEVIPYLLRSGRPAFEPGDALVIPRHRAHGARGAPVG